MNATQTVGGSVGKTALIVSVGARSRWGSIWSGLWMLVILVALSRVLGQVAMPTLAAVLIYAAVGSFKLAEIMTVLKPDGRHGHNKITRANPGRREKAAKAEHLKGLPPWNSVRCV